MQYERACHPRQPSGSVSHSLVTLAEQMESYLSHVVTL